MFAPLLSATYDPKFAPRYPVYASPKLDGIRLIIVDGVPMTRSLKKPVPNKTLQEALGGLPWLDGEIVVGTPNGDSVCANTQSYAMSRKPTEEADWRFFIFDLADPTQASLPFSTRHAGLQHVVAAVVSRRPELADRLVIHEHRLVMTADEMWKYEQENVEAGYEGIMLRDPDGGYKWGRSTAKERILTKIKRWDDTEARILEVHEEMHNENEAKINALGKMERSSHKDNKTGKNTLGGYTCETYRMPDGTFAFDERGERVEFYLGAAANSTAANRASLWDNRESLVGKILTFKYQHTLGAVAPRFPVFKNFREAE